MEPDLSFIPDDPLDRGVGFHDSDGNFYLVSQDDMGLLMEMSSISVRSDGYVRCKNADSGTDKLLHRLVLGLSDPSVFADHINRFRPDNRRSNLRIASLKQNNQNGSLRSNNTSGYKGVTYSKERRKYAAGIGVNGTRKALGRFHTAEEAARAYDAAAKELYGDFAALNFPENDVV